MVEHLVQHDPQAVTVQAADHRAELGHARAAVRALALEAYDPSGAIQW